MPSIGRKLTLSYLLISMVTVVIMEGLFFFAVSQYYLSGMEQTLLNHAEASASLYEKYAPSGEMSLKQSYIVESMDPSESALVEIYADQGNFLVNNMGSTDQSVELTPDYQEALGGESSTWRGKIESGESIMSVSVPIYDNATVVGVVRYVSSMTMANTLIQSNFMVVLFIGIIIIIIAYILGYVMSSRILVPIKDLIQVTRDIANGNLDIKAKIFYRDEIGQLAQAVNRMTEEIASSNKSKNDFISSISHELRTPLTSINGWTETIMDADDDVEVRQMGMGIISQETKRLIHLVNDLLDFSKLQSHRIELDLQLIWVNEFLEALYNQFLPRASQEGVNLRLHLDSQDAMVEGDEGRLRQVFINVVDNSFKFVKGRTHPEIIIQSHMLDDQVVITVEDNGPGMSNNELLRVKEKFYKGSSRQSGTGLGLSIANDIVTLHEGTFYIDSIRGVGTKVSVVLPFQEEELIDEVIDYSNVDTKNTDEKAEEIQH